MASPIKPSKPTSVLHDIFAWSIGRPAWQCDALRRIITKETLDESDRAELENLCRQIPGALAANGASLVAVPLALCHLPPAPNAQTSVSLEYLNNLTGVNRLPTGQKVTFGQAPGLTVIYGDNGTGKSGYVRVIKKACRTRGAPPVIQPDAFSPTHSKASCEIGIKTASGSDKINWTDGTTADEKLGNVFVFDNVAADHYLSTDGPASFTPYGLDVLLKLTKICDAVGLKIKEDIATLDREIATGKLSLEKHPNTVVGNALSKIDAKTQSANILLLGDMSAVEAKRLTDLQALLGSDPKKKAQETRAAKKRIDAFNVRLEENAGQLATVRANELKECFENATATALAAKSSTESRFDKGILVGTGSHLWRAMWEAARTFSNESAYPKDAFPHTGEDARCVLCQRPFSGDSAAISLTQSFEIFCNDDIQKAAKTASKKLVDTAKLFCDRNALKTDYEKISTDLSGATPAELKILDEFVKEADDCLATIKKSIIAGNWAVPVSLTATPSSVLTNLSDTLETRAKTEESADDPTARLALQNECNELLAKLWLKTVKTEIENLIANYQQLEVLNTRLNDTKTNSITTKNSDLTKELVTDTYCQRFSDEVKELGVCTVKVKLEELSGSKGEKKFGIRLVGTTGKINIQDIVSEGEQRCISLAAFLAELSQSSHQSALVFDDPVSSLDHNHRSRIAARLVKEVKKRQVIVFTHDTVFLNDLVTEAYSNNTPKLTYFLQWDNQRPGWFEVGLPWDCKSPEDRLAKLKHEQSVLTKAWQPIPNEDQKAKMFTAYGRLRNTIECIIEKVVFGDVVVRFRSYVDLKKEKLQRVIGFNQTEFDEIQRIFKKCCNITDAHDHPASKQAATPTPDDLQKDIEATENLLNTIRARQNS